MSDRTIRLISKVVLVLSVVLIVLSSVVFVPIVQNALLGFAERFTCSLFPRDVLRQMLVRLELKCVVVGLCVVIACIPLCRGIFCCQKSDAVFSPLADAKRLFSKKTRGVEWLVLFVALVSLRCVYISQKKSWAGDEPLSVSICNRNEFGFWGGNYEPNVVYTGKELNDISFFDDAMVKDALSDVLHLYVTSGDSPHTNFYYSLLRLAFCGVKTGDFSRIVRRGCGLNIAFFAFSFFFMLLLLERFSLGRTQMMACMVVSLGNPIAVGLTVFLRPYELTQLWTIALTYFVVWCVQVLQEGGCIENPKNLCMGTIVLAFTMLSGYFNLLLVFAYGLVLLVFFARNGELFRIGFFLHMLVCAVVLAHCMYLSFGNGLFASRGVQSLSQFSLANLVSNMRATIGGLSAVMFRNGIFSVVLFTLSLFAFFSVFAKKRTENDFVRMAVVGAACFSLFLTFWFAPYKIIRYIAPLCPIFSLLFAFRASSRRADSLSVATAFAVVFLFIPSKKCPAPVEHLDDASIAQYGLFQSAERVWFVREENGSAWKYATMIPYLKEEQTVVFVSRCADIDGGGPLRSCMAVVPRGSDCVKDISSFVPEKRASIGYYDVYELLPPSS